MRRTLPQDGGAERTRLSQPWAFRISVDPDNVPWRLISMRGRRVNVAPFSSPMASPAARCASRGSATEGRARGCGETKYSDRSDNAACSRGHDHARDRVGGRTESLIKGSPRRRRTHLSTGGEGGIRTPDTVTRMPHFECGAFNRSATSPRLALARVIARRAASAVLMNPRARNKRTARQWDPGNHISWP